MGAWIVAVLLGLLLLWNLLRERFEATPSIPAPPYNDDQKRHIYETANTADQSVLMAKAVRDNPNEADPEKLKALAGAYLAPVVGEFFTTVFRPATDPIITEDVADFMADRPLDSYPLKEIESRVLNTYYVGQQGVGTVDESGYAEILAGLGQNSGYLVNSPQSAIDAGRAAAAARRRAATAGATPASGTTASGTTASGTTASGTTDTTASATTPATASTPPAGTTVAPTSIPRTTTTGGYSATGYAPTGGSTDNEPVWGPAWSGAAEPIAGARPGDSTTHTIYPILMGGYGGGAGTPERSRVDGVGMTNASGTGITLPPIGTTGSEPNSQFLPNARVPANTGFSRDPYRLATNFSTSSYSSKTDPVPFLTDFSAFFK